MSIQAVNWAMYEVRAEQVPGNTFRVLLVLADHADPYGRGAWPSRQTISKLAGCSLRTVAYALNHLQEEGLIVRGDQRVTKGMGGYRPTVWDLNMKPPEETPKTSDAEIAPHEKDHTETPTDMQTDVQKNRTGVQTDVQHVCTKTVTKGRNHYLNQREYARASEKTIQDQQATQAALDNWHPFPNSTALAAEYGMDAEYEAAKFRDRILANGSVPADIDAAYRNWLRSGHDRGIVSNPPKPPSQHRHTWKCSHTLKALGRSEETAILDELAMATTAELNKGAQAVRTMEAA